MLQSRTAIGRLHCMLTSPSSAMLILNNGNTGGVIVVYLVNYVGFFFIALSLAEMASM